jgi:hypothetical protein
MEFFKNKIIIFFLDALFSNILKKIAVCCLSPLLFFLYFFNIGTKADIYTNFNFSIKPPKNWEKILDKSEHIFQYQSNSYKDDKGTMSITVKYKNDTTNAFNENIKRQMTTLYPEITILSENNAFKIRKGIIGQKIVFKNINKEGQATRIIFYTFTSGILVYEMKCGIAEDKGQSTEKKFDQSVKSFKLLR